MWLSVLAACSISAARWQSTLPEPEVGKLTGLPKVTFGNPAIARNTFTVVRESVTNCAFSVPGLQPAVDPVQPWLLLLNAGR